MKTTWSRIWKSECVYCQNTNHKPLSSVQTAPGREYTCQYWQYMCVKHWSKDIENFVGLMYVDSTWPWMLQQLQDNLRAIKFSPHSKTYLINIFMKANFEANQSPSADTTVLNQIRHAKLRNISWTEMFFVPDAVAVQSGQKSVVGL